jgi:hypothetical protein
MNEQGEPQMVHEQIAINLETLGIAFLIIWDADKLLNAILDDGPKAELIRELAVSLDRIQLCFIDFDLEDCHKVYEAMTECKWQTARLDRDLTTLILEREESKALADPEYWPGHNWGKEL